MKQRRYSVIVILLFFLVLSIPLFTQTRVFPEISSIVPYFSNIFYVAYEKAASQSDRIRLFAEAGKINGRFILFWVVLPSVAGLGFISLVLQNRRLRQRSRRLETESEAKKQNEDDLGRCTQYLDRINKHSPITSYRFRYAAPWQIEFISEAVRDLTGYGPSHFIGHSAKTYADLIHPEDQDRVSGHFETAFQDKRPIVITYRILDKNGHVKWVCEKAMGFGNPVNPVSDPRSAPWGIEGFIVDITKEKRFEMEKMLGRSMLHSLIDALPERIYFKDRKGEYLACNMAFAEFAGKRRSDIVGKTDYDLFPKDAADMFRENDLKMLSRMKQRKNHERISSPDGRKTLYETLRTPLTTTDGKILGLVGVSRDITAVISENQGMDVEFP